MNTNWCTFCDSAISPFSDSLYCSEECLKQDALIHHPLLGYDYSDLKGFPHPHQQRMPVFARRKSSIPSLENFFSTVPSSLSSSLSSNNTTTTTFYQPKPHRLPSSIHFLEDSVMSS